MARCCTVTSRPPRGWRRARCPSTTGHSCGCVWIEGLRRSDMRIPGQKIAFSETERREILERWERCLATGQLAMGENSQQFECEFAKHLGGAHAVATSSGG